MDPMTTTSWILAQFAPIRIALLSFFALVTAVLAVVSIIGVVIYGHVKKPPYQFSLRTMFVVTAVMCVLFWLAGIVYNWPSPN
jgi:hypothetical protein